MISTHASELSSLAPMQAGLKSSQPASDPQQLVSQNAQKHIEGRATAGFKPLTAEQAASNILGFIGRQLDRDVAAGATQEELQSRLDAGLSGFKKGFAEAKEKLEALSLLTPAVEKDIGKTYDLVTQGINDFAKQYGLNDKSVDVDVKAPELAPRVSAQYDYAAAQSFSFELTTKEGDKVTIRAAASTGQSASYQKTEEGSRFSYASVSSSQYQLTIEGDLNEEEQAAINNLMGKVNELAAEFYHGDLQTAFNYASNLGYDTEQIGGFALNLTRVEIQRASVAYQADRPAQSLQGQLAPVGDFIQNLQSTLNDAAAFDGPRSLLQSIIESMFGENQPLEAEVTSEDTKEEAADAVAERPNGQAFVDFVNDLLESDLLKG